MSIVWRERVGRDRVGNERQREREGGRHTHTHREREGGRERHTERERERERESALTLMIFQYLISEYHFPQT